VNGLLLLGSLVLAGLAAGAGLYRYKQPQAVAALEAELAAAPTSAEGLLQLWHEITAPQIHALIAATRISAQQPWLVTHQVRPPGERRARVYGIDVDALAPELSRVEGLRVRIGLPSPRFLAETVLVGDNARDVPSFADELDGPQALGRLRTIVDHLFGSMAGALAQEERLGGASLELWVEGEPEPWPIEPDGAGD
jgi:hypothetical protein